MSVCQGLCGYGSSVFAAWKGEVGDDRLFFGTFNGTSWDDQGNTIPGNSSVGPALAATANGLIYAAWKGEDDNDDRLFYAPYNVSKQTWSSQTQIPNVASSIGPALAAIGNTLYAAWVGTNNDLSMHFASFDPSNQNPTWSSLPGIPATDVPAVTSSSIGPALAAIGPTLYAAWADVNGILHYASLNTSAPTPTWSSPTQIPNALSSIGPSLAALGGTLYAAWKGEGNDQGLYYASFDPSNKNPTWSAHAVIPNASSSIGPALAALGSTLYAIWTGPGSNQSLYYASFVPSNKNPTWSNPATVGGNSGQDMVPPPIGGLGSNSNYLLYGGSCNPATNLGQLSVTIEITEDIVCDDLGFHVRAYAPEFSGI
jgi:hypothetical protein